MINNIIFFVFALISLFLGFLSNYLLIKQGLSLSTCWTAILIFATCYEFGHIYEMLWKFLKIYIPGTGANNLLQNAKMIPNPGITFKDVAGYEEAKIELKEVVQFLKNPEPFRKLGATLPKGVLLGGPPGTGKTLLAKAISGEAGVPFFIVSGAGFVELFAGGGASRVRNLFKAAQAVKPSIIFIDEIDAIAKARASGAAIGGTNDEREQTLNQILVEMDGFKPNDGVVVIAASNRIDILDPAITRPGRFDRQIILGLPTLSERLAILEVHARGKKLDSSVLLPQIAQRATGCSGADLANILNEAAILAVREKKAFIDIHEINESIDRALYGLKGKQIVRSKPRHLIAFHEIGHALVSSLLNEDSPVDRVRLTGRGPSQVRTTTIPSLNLYNSRDAFIIQILTLISGRASEEVMGGIGECTTFAQGNIAQATRNVRVMILRYAMSKLQELKQQAQQRNLYLLGSDMKQELNNIADNFTTNFINITYTEIVRFLGIARPAGERLIDELLSSEELTGSQLRALASEYFSSLYAVEALDRRRESLLYELLLPLLEDAVADIEKVTKLVEKK